MINDRHNLSDEVAHTQKSLSFIKVRISVAASVTRFDENSPLWRNF